MTPKQNKIVIDIFAWICSAFIVYSVIKIII